MFRTEIQFLLIWEPEKAELRTKLLLKKFVTLIALAIAKQYNNQGKIVMEIQYITDKKGQKSAVLLPIETWEKIQKDLMDLQNLKNQSKNKLSDKFCGAISKDTANKLHDHINKVRIEWEESIYKQAKNQ